HGIAGHLPQGPDGQVGLLGEEEDARAARQADLAAAEWPDAGDGPEERALAGTRRPADERGVPGANSEVDVFQQRLAARQLEIHAIQREPGLGPRLAVDALLRRLRAHPAQGALEAEQAPDHRAPHL